MIDLVAVGRRIAAQREKLDLTQEQLAELAGVHKMTISRLERGALPNPGTATWNKIAQALHMPVSTLLAPSDAALVAA